MPERMRADVLIIGAGAAGLFAALHLPEETDVLVVDKGSRGRGSSFWAQGGVAAALGPGDSPQLHAEDTSRVAAGHADPSAVAVLSSEAPECVLELVELGCAFDRTSKGELHLAREGGQSVARSAHAADATGAAIMDTLRKAAGDRIRRIEGACVKLAVVDGRCAGGWVLTDEGLIEISATSTVLASGGVGGLFASTTNPPGATGDGWALAWEAGAGLADIEFVQFHPTALALGSGQQRVLVTEALRGAGAFVVDAEGRRFLFDHHSDGELAPRDVVARAIWQRKAWLDCRHLAAEVLESEFGTVVAACRSFGVDPLHDLIPVVPAAHYSMGGVQTDLDGRASIPRLYAIGECANTGVHGANRLAGNSLAEALVFARRAARAIEGQRAGRIKSLPSPPELQEASVSVPEAWKLVRRICTEALGIERDGPRLSLVADSLEDFALLPLTTDRAALELRAGAITARLMARAASLRRESRGVHFRTDFPQPDPAWAGIRLRLARS
ncbi:MAG: L-aspartate oxidase [Actinomycetota bacterium]|jgi:L-aspartate oxidase|nr:L-aspartate oxidase [Actinomycetota bacterium]